MTLLSVRDLGKSFGGVHAVRDVSFDLGEGEILALIGPNGAGKSTLFNMLNGQIRADRGRIRLDGQELVGLSPRRIWAQGVGRTFQIAETYASMTALENVQMSLLSREGRLLGLFRRASRLCREEAMDLLGQVGMAEQHDRTCGLLSYGDVKRVELAMALSNRPRLLLMDEPTAGMAARERQAMMALTASVARARRMAVLFTEHSMDVVFAHAHRIMVLSRGVMVADGAPAAVRNDPTVREIYFGSGASFGGKELIAA